MLAQAVRGTDHLPGAEAAAGEQGTAHLRPVVAAGLRIDLRRPAKLAPHDDGHVVEHAPVAEVVEERREALVELAAMVAHEVEVLPVAVPAAVAEAHHPHARLHEPPGHEQVVVAGGCPVVLILVGLAVTVGLANLRILLGEVEGVEQPAAGEHVERPLRERVHAAHDPGGVGLPLEAVHAREELPAVAEPLERHRPQRHVLEVRPIRLERRVGRPEEAGLAGVRPGHVLGLGGEADVRRHGRIDRALEFRHGRAHRGPAPDRPQAALRPAGHALKSGVGPLAADDRADDRAAFHPRRQPGKHLADLDARHVRADRLEFAAHLARGVGLQVPHVLMRGAAAEEDVDEGLVTLARPADWCGRLGPHEPREREAAGAERQAADREELPTGRPVAHPRAVAEDRQHGVILTGGGWTGRAADPKEDRHTTSRKSRPGRQTLTNPTFLSYPPLPPSDTPWPEPASPPRPARQHARKPLPRKEFQNRPDPPLWRTPPGVRMRPVRHTTSDPPPRPLDQGLSSYGSSRGFARLEACATGASSRSTRATQRSHASLSADDLHA